MLTLVKAPTAKAKKTAATATTQLVMRQRKQPQQLPPPQPASPPLPTTPKEYMEADDVVANPAAALFAAVSLTATTPRPSPQFLPSPSQPLRLTYQQGVQFYSDPQSNPALSEYMNRLLSKELTEQESQMLFWTVESIAVLAYSIYDHLFFHTYERMFDLGRKQALKEMFERENKILTALEPVVDVFLTRAESFRDRQDVACSPGFSECLAEIANNWKDDIAGIWRALPKETGF